MKRGKLPKGIITIVILSALLDKEGYGYLLQREVKKILGQSLSRGEIYSILRHLEIKGLVKKIPLDRGRRTYYTTTDKGRDFLLSQEESLSSTISVLQNIMKSIASRRSMG